jgi:hypothetical protein
MHVRSVRRLLLSVLICLASLPAVAQNGRFSGQVTDPQGAAISGASIQVINQQTLVRRETASDANGMYGVAYLPAGKYQVIVAAGSFNTSIAQDVALGVDGTVVYNVQLTIGSATTEVRVEAEGATEVNTQSAEVSGTITGNEVASLALNGRNFTQLITMTPGVSNQSQQDEALVGPVGQAKYSFNGGRVEYNSFEVDGSDVLNLSIYPTAVPLIVTPSLDAIQEIKVMTSNYGAQYGRTASGVVEVTTKSGTNSFHGNGYEYVRNEMFNARNYFDPTNHGAPLYRRNDFGFTLGGPLYIPHFYNARKDKTYFFFSEEARVERTPVSYAVGAPSAKELVGDFSEFCPPAGTLPPGATDDPNCPTALGSAGFKSQSGDANMFAIAAQGLIPAANSSSGGCSSSTGLCYNAAISPLTDWREELFRIDNDLSSRNRLTLRYIHDAWNTTVLSPQWGYLGSANTYPTIQNTFVGPGIDVLAGLSSTLTQSLLNSIFFSYTDSQITLKDVGAPGVNLSRPAILDSTTAASGYKQDAPIGYIYNNGFGGKIPGIVFTGIGNDFGGGNLLLDTGTMPWEHTSPTYNLTDNMTKMWGKHTLQGGTQLILLERNQINSAVGAATGDVQGMITFSASGTVNTMASFLEGSRGVSYQQDSAQGRFHQRAIVAEPYLQDDWKVTSRLTLNFGLRMSLFGNFYERGQQLYNWEASQFNWALTDSFYVDPTWGTLIDNATGQPFPRNTGNLDPRTANGLVRCGYNGVPASCMSPHLWNPAPRVGFAWDVTGHGTAALRAGYGMFYEHGTPYEANSGSLEANPPAVSAVEEYNIGGLGVFCIGGQDSAGGCQGHPTLQGAFPLSFTSIPTQTKWAYAQQWNLSYQQQLPRNFVVTAGYVGSKGTHLTAELQLNQLTPVPAALNPFGPHQPIDTSIVDLCSEPNGIAVHSPNLEIACVSGGYGGGTSGGGLTPTSVRAFAPGIDKIASIEPIATSSYHAFQFLGRRTKGPLTLDLAYTYSHSIDDSSDRTDIPVNGLDIRANKASSSFDQRHLFESSYVYRLPLLSFLRNFLSNISRDPDSENKAAVNRPPSYYINAGFAKVLLEGWDFSGLTLFQTGTPFSVYNSGYRTASYSAGAVDNAGVANGLSPLYESYPDLVGSARRGIRAAQLAGGNNSLSKGPLLLNPAAFAAPRGLTFGNAGRNVLNNPRRTNFDMSLLKHFTLPRESDLEFRAEAFNIFNHTQFRIYDPTFGNTSSNTVSCYGDATANYSAAGGDGTDCYAGSGFLHPYDAHRPRTLQFGLKLAF